MGHKIDKILHLELDLMKFHISLAQRNMKIDLSYQINMQKGNTSIGKLGSNTDASNTKEN